MRQHTVQTPYLVGEAHFYSTELAGNLVLFDTGPATPGALAALGEQLDLSRLKYVFITHSHVDHYGLAAQLAEHTAAEIFLPRMDAIKFRRHGERLVHIERLLAEYGFDAALAKGFRQIVADINIFPDPPQRFTIVEESDIPAALGISWLSCPGHSQSDLVYRVGNWAVSGDILLKGIFQAPLLDVDFQSFSGRFRNYDAYCLSLLELSKLRGCRILPGHRDSVASLDDTILFYVNKMLERAGQVKKFSDAASIRDVVGLVFKDALTDPFVIYLKVSEIVFMRDFLAEPERLKASLEQIGLFDKVSDLYATVV